MPPRESVGYALSIIISNSNINIVINIIIINFIIRFFGYIKNPIGLLGGYKRSKYKDLRHIKSLTQSQLVSNGLNVFQMQKKEG